MSEIQTFRSAFNGFNREDVVNHISYMTTKHETLANQLRSEAQTLRTERDDLQAQLDETCQNQELVPQLEETVAQLQAENAALADSLKQTESRIAELEQQLEEALNAATQPVASPAPAGAPIHWDELQAYRRAENTERRARERVNFLYDKANAALAEVTGTLGGTTEQINDLAEKVRADLVALQDAIDQGRAALTSTAATLDTLRPEMDE